MSNPDTFPINYPDPGRADALAEQAMASAREGDYVLAIRLIEEAIRLDQIGALSGIPRASPRAGKGSARPRPHQYRAPMCLWRA